MSKGKVAALVALGVFGWLIALWFGVAIGPN